ncbi:MAG: PDZ domain-containing protein, partial [Bdellovibrionaceae bacterium]|nr:PDZ domain-containing protein [Pseudobdellovibrionaceae bacterium]
KPYDLIIEFNGRKIKNSTELIDAVADAPIGKETTMKVLRQKGDKFVTLTLKVTPAERPSERPVSRGRPDASPPSGKLAPHAFGFRVSAMSEELRSKL